MRNIPNLIPANARSQGIKLPKVPDFKHVAFPAYPLRTKKKKRGKSRPFRRPISHSPKHQIRPGASGAVATEKAGRMPIPANAFTHRHKKNPPRAHCGLPSPFRDSGTPHETSARKFPARERNNPQGRNARKAHAPSLGLKYPRCFSDMGRPTRSITASMSSHTSRFFSAFAYWRRKEGW